MSYDLSLDAGGDDDEEVRLLRLLGQQRGMGEALRRVCLLGGDGLRLPSFNVFDFKIFGGLYSGTMWSEVDWGGVEYRAAPSCGVSRQLLACFSEGRQD